MNKLDLALLKNYRVDIKHVAPYRDVYTVIELDECSVPTGRAWSEPFNAVSGNPDELAARFTRRISDENGPTPEDYSELTLFANAIANESMEANRPYVSNAITSVLSKFMRQVTERCELLSNSKEAPPEQVILESGAEKLTEWILDILRRSVAKGAREAAAQSRYPYETIRLITEELRTAAEHYRLSRWGRLKSLFTRDRNATGID